MVSEPPQSAILVTVRVGTQLGIESAQTRVFLAFAPDHDYAARSLKELTARDSAQARRDIATAAATGGCQVELHGGDGIVAAHGVFDQNGIVAALGIVGTRSAMRGQSDNDRVGKLRRTALAITEALAGTATYHSALAASAATRTGKKRATRKG
jgi:DNA-binding IclR family transcriptional regulator